ncbi:MAG: hypothetical protein LBB76_02605 [Azoarcus sp.]|nr:hypothetical protein [Azoarcus sp.]
MENKVTTASAPQIFRFQFSAPVVGLEIRLSVVLFAGSRPLFSLCWLDESISLLLFRIFSGSIHPFFTTYITPKADDKATLKTLSSAE